MVMIERKNSEHYDDLTAWQALRNIDSEDRFKQLIKVLRYIISVSGFELTERICLLDKKTGKKYR